MRYLNLNRKEDTAIFLDLIYICRPPDKQIFFFFGGGGGGGKIGNIFLSISLNICFGCSKHPSH